MYENFKEILDLDSDLNKHRLCSSYLLPRVKFGADTLIWLIAIPRMTKKSLDFILLDSRFVKTTLL